MFMRHGGLMDMAHFDALLFHELRVLSSFVP